MKAATKFKPSDLLEAIRQGESMNELRSVYGLHSDFIIEFAAHHGLSVPKQGPGPKATRHRKQAKPKTKWCPSCDQSKRHDEFYDADCYCKPCRQAQSKRSYEKRMGRPVKAKAPKLEKRRGNQGIMAHSEQADFQDTLNDRLPLIRAAKAGDKEAQETLWQRYKVVCRGVR